MVRLCYDTRPDRCFASYRLTYPAFSPTRLLARNLSALFRLYHKITRVSPTRQYSLRYVNRPALTLDRYSSNPQVKVRRNCDQCHPPTDSCAYKESCCSRSNAILEMAPWDRDCQ